MFEDGGLSTAKDDAMEKLDSGVKELRADRKQQFDKMTEMLNSGKVNDMTLEQKENFVQLYKMLKQHHNFAKGGMLEDGGLMQEGGTVDPVSGNDVPVGSTQEEVRDDIPAQLSEGEFVMPADVVRYHGLDKMMALRDEAKAGLQRMDDMGQMGNSEEAVIPDGIPFDLNDLDIEDEPMEMQVGGFVQQPFGITQAANQPFQYQQSAFQNYVPQVNVPATTTPTTYTPVTQEVTPTIQKDVLPSFETAVVPTTVTYVNDAGAEIQIPVDAQGNPLIPVPEGFKKKSEAAVTEPTTPPVQPTTQATTPQQKEDPSDSREFGGGPAGLTRGQSQIAALTQLDPSFANTISDINKKYPDPGIEGLLSPIATIVKSFKKSNEINSAVKGYDYDALAKNRGLTTNDLKGTLNTFGDEIFSGYRNAETGEVSGQKDMRSIGQIASEFVSPKTYDNIDEFGNIADDGTMPESTRVKTATVTGDKEKTITEAAIQTPIYSELTSIQKEMVNSVAPNKYNEKVANILGIEFNTTDVGRNLTPLEQNMVRDATTQDLMSMQSSRNATTQDLMSMQSSGKAKPKVVDIDPEGVVAEESKIASGEGRVDPGLAAAAKAQQNKEVERQTRNYTNRGYSSSNAKTAAKNKVAADTAARQQARDRGDPPDRVNKTTAVTDSKGNAVTNINAKGEKTIVTSAPREEKSDSPGGRWCCSQMVHHGIWTHQGEFARLTVWSMKQPNWWRSGYDVWGKFLAKTFLRKQGFWSNIMQSFFDYHIRNKPYTWRTALAHVMVYPGVFICGHIWTKVPETVRLAKFEELNN